MDTFFKEMKTLILVLDPQRWRMFLLVYCFINGDFPVIEEGLFTAKVKTHPTFFPL